MHEEGDGMNENENSEVVVLPDKSRVEELLLSERSQIHKEQSSYERRLDERLKDLGLYEEEMTINQKEELLTVVIISCKTAEQEENKRQLIKEYLEGAQNLEEEIEFSFQESAWLAEEANLLSSSTVTQSKPCSHSSKDPQSFSGHDSPGEKKYENLESPQVEGNECGSSPDVYEDDMSYMETSDPQCSSSSKPRLKKPSIRRGKSRISNALGQQSYGSGLKIAATPPMPHASSSKETEETQKLEEKLLLNKSMSTWKPCMSPSDELLSSSITDQKKKKDNPLSSLDHVYQYLSSFDEFASCLSVTKSSRTPVQLSKPYILLHHGSVAKKACKLDNYDYTIGVTDRIRTLDISDESLLGSTTLTRAKSAFHRVKPSTHGKIFLTSDGDSKTTRSGACYGPETLEEAKAELVSEVHADSSFEQGQGVSGTIREKRVCFFDEVKATETLPKFSNLRPERCNSVCPSPLNPREILYKKCNSTYPESSKSIMKGNFVNSPIQDGSSHSSSPLIDVETIIEDELDDSFLKRKAVETSVKSDSSKNLNHSKKMKRSDS